MEWIEPVNSCIGMLSIPDCAAACEKYQYKNIGVLVLALASLMTAFYLRLWPCSGEYERLNNLEMIGWIMGIMSLFTFIVWTIWFSG